MPGIIDENLFSYVFILFNMIINKWNTNKRPTCTICLKYLKGKYNSATKTLREALWFTWVFLTKEH